MRSDFIGDCAQFPELTMRINERHGGDRRIAYAQTGPSMASRSDALICDEVVTLR